MERFIDGDDAAFEALFQRLAPRVRQSLRFLAGDAALADDLTQVTFLKVLRASGTYRRGMSVEAWIYGIARHAYFDERRRGFRTHEVLAADPISPQVASELPSEPSAREESLARALELLPEPQREALVLLKVYELSAKEAAAAVGTSEAAIKMRAQRGYETLRRLLEGVAR